MTAFENWIIATLGVDAFGDSKGSGMWHPPGDYLNTKFGEMDHGHDPPQPLFTAATNTDGWHICIGYTGSDRYTVCFRQEEARSLAWFILWQWWAKATWFGLKRRIWYWALSRKVNRQRRLTEPGRQVAERMKKLEAHLHERTG